MARRKAWLDGDLNDAWEKMLGQMNVLFMDGAYLEQRARKEGEPNLSGYAGLGRLFFQRLVERRSDYEVRRFREELEEL